MSPVTTTSSAYDKRTTTIVNMPTTTGSIVSQKTPFKYDKVIKNELIEDFHRIRVDNVPLERNIIQEKVESLCSWLCTTPNSIAYRVNTLVTNIQEILCLIAKNFQLPQKMINFRLPEMLIIKGFDNHVELDLKIYCDEVIVDASCGTAVLRGAHVFAPGILAMPPGLKLGSKVSVFADTSGNCKKGAKIYDNSSKIFLGNGTIEQTRKDLFAEGACPSGIAIRISDVQSRLPQLGDSTVKKGHAILQNPPSIICSRILDPQPGERILDMCAAPGNKTTHISALMNDEGTLVALEKIKSKIERLRENCRIFNCNNVTIHCYDSTKAVCNNKKSEELVNEPPFPEASFDRILLDGPCSALGQRPQLLNRISAKELRSYVPLQRKLFTTAVKLLKIGGVLVYSTCTITIAENEGIVAWAIKNFSCLKLSPVRHVIESMELDEKYRGSCGYNIDGLSDDETKNLLRFGTESDTVGFFIARFVKTH